MKTKRQKKQKNPYGKLLKKYSYPDINNCLDYFIQYYGYLEWNEMDVKVRVKMIENKLINDGVNELKEINI